MGCEILKTENVQRPQETGEGCGECCHACENGQNPSGDDPEPRRPRGGRHAFCSFVRHWGADQRPSMPNLVPIRNHIKPQNKLGYGTTRMEVEARLCYSSLQSLMLRSRASLDAACYAVPHRPSRSQALQPISGAANATAAAVHACRSWSSSRRVQEGPARCGCRSR